MGTTLPENLSTRPATMDDLEAAVALFNACAIEQIGRPVHNLNDLRSRWTSPVLHQETDTLVVISPDDELVGYVEVWDHKPHVQLFAYGRVHPEFAGRGIGTHLVKWSERRARQAAANAPKGARVVIHQDTLSTNTEAQGLLRQHGYEVVRHSVRMVIDLDAPPPEPVFPGDITVRTCARGDVRPVVKAVNEAFRDHWGYVETPFEQMLEEFTHWTEDDPDHDPTLWFLAMDGDEIAGTSLCHPIVAEDPELGFIFTLSVRRPWRKQGLAMALLHHSFGEFYRRGKRRVGLNVDAQSLTGATRLYEKAGMHSDRRYVTFEKELRPGKDLSTRTLEG
jgi:ribosomal protein S18 acetylase RimI-like enzyme